MSRSDTRTEYAVRPYRPGDGEQFVRLYETVWGARRSPDWFEWRYLDAPYLPDPPLFVAEHQGEVVGTRGFFAFRMHVGDETPLALLTVDSMVHPDHRRRGLFGRTTDAALDHYADDVAFVFMQPNERALAGYEKLGVTAVGPTSTWYRIQDSATLLDDRVDAPVAVSELVGRAVTGGARGYLRLCDTVAGSADDVSVSACAGVTPAVLRDLYERTVPDAIHAVRDERFYRWRFGGPAWSRTTYVASVGDEPVAAVLARVRTTQDGISLAQVADVVPMVGGARRSAAVAAILDRVVRDHREAAVLAVPGGLVPGEVLVSRGFLPDGRFPLSALADHRGTLAARPLGDRDWTMSGRSLLDEANWLLSFAEQDTT